MTIRIALAGLALGAAALVGTSTAEVRSTTVANQVAVLKYFPENTGGRVAVLKYFPENTGGRVAVLKYFPENTGGRFA